MKRGINYTQTLGVKNVIELSVFFVDQNKRRVD